MDKNIPKPDAIVTGFERTKKVFKAQKPIYSHK